MALAYTDVYGADRLEESDEVFIRKQGEDVILSPRPIDWGAYLDTGPVASDAFMENVEDLPVQEREP